MNFHEYKMKIKTHDVKSAETFFQYDTRVHNYEYLIRFHTFTDGCNSK